MMQPYTKEHRGLPATPESHLPPSGGLPPPRLGTWVRLLAEPRVPIVASLTSPSPRLPVHPFSLQLQPRCGHGNCCLCLHASLPCAATMGLLSGLCVNALER